MKRKQIQIKTLAKHEQATSNLELSHEIEQFKFKPNTHAQSANTHYRNAMRAQFTNVLFFSFRYVTFVRALGFG